MNATETRKLVLLPAIDNIKNKQEKEILLQQDLDNIDGKLLVELEEIGFQTMMILEKNINITHGTIKHLYELIYKECDKYVANKRLEMFGIQFDDLMTMWKHCLLKHMDFYNHDCKQNLFKCDTYDHKNNNDDSEDNKEEEKEEYDACVDCKFKLDKCEDEKCETVTRNMKRSELINSSNHSEVYGEYRNKNINKHIKYQIHNDKYFQYELDSIHNHLLHDPNSIYIEVPLFNKKQSKKRTTERTSENFMTMSLDLNKLSTLELEKLKEIQEEIDELKDDDIEQLESNIKATINKDKYTTDIGLYGFGVDHRHHFLKPFDANTSLKDEMLSSGYVTENAWESVLNKAFNKVKLISNNQQYKSKQYSNDYSINRGDSMSVHHMMAICFYTDFSHLCTDYRSTFRKMGKDVNDDSIRERHSKYYFLSRFLYEAIEFFGHIMSDQQTVYHGLDKPFLFKEFLTHFNAPTSTTPDLLCAVNFSKESGIILALRNGNDAIDTNAIVSQFMKDQPRYVDVSWISDFSHEKEYLYYGDNIIFKIHDIYHTDKAQIPKNTLKQLNLLQRIIENKEINWEKEPKSRVNKLCQKLQKTREMNIALLTPNNEEDAKYTNEANLLEQKLIKSMPSEQFIDFAMKILHNETITKKK
eukprot:320105_1